VLTNHKLAPKWRGRRDLMLKFWDPAIFCKRIKLRFSNLVHRQSLGSFNQWSTNPQAGSCSGGRGNVLAVRNCCYVAVCSAARGASAPTGGGEGAYRDGRPPTACCWYEPIKIANATQFAVRRVATASKTDRHEHCISATIIKTRKVP